MKTCGECEYCNKELGLCELLEVDVEENEEACEDAVREAYENESD